MRRDSKYREESLLRWNGAPKRRSAKTAQGGRGPVLVQGGIHFSKDGCACLSTDTFEDGRVHPRMIALEDRQV